MRTDIDPEDTPEDAVPVCNSTAPLDDALLSADVKVIRPLADAVLAPEVTVTAPPVEAVEAPASIFIEPAISVAVPTLNSIPPELVAAVPVDIFTFPL